MPQETGECLGANVIDLELTKAWQAGCVWRVYGHEHAERTDAGPLRTLRHTSNGAQQRTENAANDRLLRVREASAQPNVGDEPHALTSAVLASS